MMMKRSIKIKQYDTTDCGALERTHMQGVSAAYTLLAAYLLEK